LVFYNEPFYFQPNCFIGPPLRLDRGHSPYQIRTDVCGCLLMGATRSVLVIGWKTTAHHFHQLPLRTPLLKVHKAWPVYPKGVCCQENVLFVLLCQHSLDIYLYASKIFICFHFLTDNLLEILFSQDRRRYQRCYQHQISFYLISNTNNFHYLRSCGRNYDIKNCSELSHTLRFWFS
jgi:hypothetical protein